MGWSTPVILVWFRPVALGWVMRGGGGGTRSPFSNTRGLHSVGGRSWGFQIRHNYSPLFCLSVSSAMFLLFSFFFMLKLLFLSVFLMVTIRVSRCTKIWIVSIIGPWSGSLGQASFIPSAWTGVTQLVSFAPLLSARGPVGSQSLHLLLPVRRGFTAVIIFGLRVGSWPWRCVIANRASSFDFPSRLWYRGFLITYNRCNIWNVLFRLHSDSRHISSK